MCEVVIFRVGDEVFGFEAHDFINYQTISRALCSPVLAGTFPCYIGYVYGGGGREILLQDLRVRFGFREAVACAQHNCEAIVFQDRRRKLHGFIVDEMIDFCSTRNEQATPWGIDTMLDSVRYKPFVEGLGQAVVDRRTTSFWMLRLQDLLPPESVRPA